MKKYIAVLLCFLFPLAALSAESGYAVKYDGGSITDLKTGTELRLVMNGKDILLMHKHDVVQTIPAASVTEISYGQDVHRRIGAAIGLAIVSFGLGALMALTKSKKHFVGLTWQTGDTKGGFAMQCDKNDYRGILTGLEGLTGKKAIDSEAMTVKN